MSGFAGVLRTDGAPIDPAVFDRFSPILRQRGPDGDGSWMDRGIGFGYSDLKIEDRRPKSGPFLFSDESAIVGDVRLDARDELIGELAFSGLEKPTHQPDLELVLRAYRRWGKRCLEHLKGDFSFALWDRKERSLLFGRDHFGVRPFYYGTFGDTLVFSNTLACLLIFDELAAPLDESVIGEYLLFGDIDRLERTPFLKIRRLPPGHSLSCSNGKRLHVQRYWSLVPKETGHRLKKDDILHQFEHRMRLAVWDRLPASEALVMMSGGLDSTCVAAFASELGKKADRSCMLHACTFGWKRWLPDRETEFAREAAESLGIPIHSIDCGEDTFRWSPDGCNGFSPEPTSDLPMSELFQQYLDLLKKCRVSLTGQGGDPALHPRPWHAGSFFKSLIFNGLGKEMLRHRIQTGAFPHLGLRSSIRQWVGHPDHVKKAIPPWIAPDFFKRCDIDQLLQERDQKRKPLACLRSEAYHFVSGSVWASLFEHGDAGSTGVAAQIRHPFFDLRVMTFLLSLPPIPWCLDKAILRQTLAGRLPDKIVQRPKTPLAGQPLYEMIMASPRPLPVEKLLVKSGLSRFIALRRYLQILKNPDKIRPTESELITKPLGLAWWLAQEIGGTPKSTCHGRKQWEKTDQPSKTGPITSQN